MGDEGESDRLIVPSTSSALRRIPALTVDASPSDGGKWTGEADCPELEELNCFWRGLGFIHLLPRTGLAEVAL